MGQPECSHCISGSRHLSSAKQGVGLPRGRGGAERKGAVEQAALARQHNRLGRGSSLFTQPSFVAGTCQVSGLGMGGSWGVGLLGAVDATERIGYDNLTGASAPKSSTGGWGGVAH